MIPFSSYVKALFVTLVLTGLGVQSLGAADGRASGSGDEEENQSRLSLFLPLSWTIPCPEPTPEMPEPWRINDIMEYIRGKIGPEKCSFSMEESALLKDELIPHITPDSERFNRVFESVRESIREPLFEYYYEEPRDLWSSVKDLGMYSIFTSVACFMIVWAQDGFVDEKGVNLYERLGPFTVFIQQVCFLSYLVNELAYYTRVKMCPPRRDNPRINSAAEKDIYLTALVATSLYLPDSDRLVLTDPRTGYHKELITDEKDLASSISYLIYRSTSGFKPKGHNAAFWVLNKFPELRSDYYSKGY
jgi:hypothetical protein